MPIDRDMPPGGDITTFLRGARYPVDRDALLRCAEAEGAPEPALRLIRRLENRIYEGVAEVARALDQARARSAGGRSGRDRVEEASEESFPASDAPGYAPSSHVGKPAGRKKPERS